MYYVDFWGKKRGIIVESGALDGLKFSTTTYFERLHQWIPIHVEASPINYANLVRNRHKGALNIHAALCDTPHAIDVHFLDGTNHKKGVRATAGIAEFMRPEFAQKFHPEVS